MWKSNGLRFWALLALMGSIKSSTAQDVTLMIDEAALIAGQATVTGTGHNYNPGLLALFPNITVKGTGDLNNTSGTGSPVPINKITATYIKGTAIGNTVTLNTSTQTMTAALLELGLLSAGPFTVKYDAAGLSGTAWQAGTYANTLTYGVTAVGIGTSISPTTVNLTVTVPALIKEVSPPASILLQANNLDFFRSTTLETTCIIPVRHTVPVKLQILANAAQLSFTNGYSGVADPLTGSSKVQVQTTTPSGPAVSLTTAAQQLVASAAVATGNTTGFNARFFISPADLKTSFINKGNYATTVTLQGSNANTGGPAATYSKVLNLSVAVSDLAELTLGSSQVSFLLQTTGDYKNGVTLNLANHLKVSKTTPYDVSVRAQSANFTSGSGATIPVSILSIGPSGSQANTTVVNELSTSGQLLVNGAAPAIDRLFDIQYQISAAQTQSLINKPAGVYSGTVVYTLTAH